ncbi:TonB-dependent receptor plug domain-containing protein [Beijerinckia mobilis]|uniref:TonB-dependent receptor plug domain-containing protein n=1 Tax=Beijerinckia mobilis TaxID=231434 RepID=UPI00068B5F58|nr:TonB-dependent receptor [Beijerinckia mobilis]
MTTHTACQAATHEKSQYSKIRQFETAATFAGLLLATSPVDAQEVGVFSLGEINISASKSGSREQTSGYGGSVITNEDAWKFGRDTLDQAVTLAPGVSASNSGGPRNERLIYVRGFDRFQTPLSIDGIRVYLPADNRLDFGRFLTADVSEIQIAKGYDSVLDGPGGMGGAINLVTRKAQKEVDGEMRTGMLWGQDGTLEGGSAYLFLGTKQPTYYLQGSASFLGTRGWILSHEYTPTSVQGSGLRDHSDTTDGRGMIKVGVTPNATDEYSFNYIKQVGRKGAPLHVSDPVASQRYWDWPYWNIQNIYFLSNTQLSDAVYLKSRVYFNTFDNSLYSYDDRYLSTQSLPRSFQSAYHDYALGGSVEAGINFGTADTLKGTFQYRRDNHVEWQGTFSTTSPCVANVICFREPDQTTTEDTYTIALENTWHITPNLDFVQGFAYNWRHMLRAQDYNTTDGFINYPLRDVGAPDGQAALIWRYEENSKLFANVSSRVRFPTIFDRFSSRFGGAVSNPGLQPERATNYQIGWATTFNTNAEFQTAAFVSDVKNLIQSVPFIYNNTALTQSQNVGDGYFVGIEAAGTYQIQDNLMIGGNLTFIRRSITSPRTPYIQPTGVPFAQGFLYLTYRPEIIPGLSITPNVELADSRWTSNTAGTYYYPTGSYQLLNFQATYNVASNFELQAGLRNILDQNYQLVDGFPEPGRTVFFNMRVTF